MSHILDSELETTVREEQYCKYNKQS